MKKFCILFLMISIFIADVSYAQSVDSRTIFMGSPSGSRTDSGEMTKEQHDAIWKRITRKADSLVAAGIIPPVNPDAVVDLHWPLHSLVDSTGYWRAGHFPDHNSRTGRLLDYNGGDRTYDRRSDGYNHSGTDFILWPFSWHKMDNNEVEVVAAAAGYIVDKDSQNPDKRCYDFSHGTFDFNSVWVQHDDGTFAWYVHLKRNSLTTKRIGQRVEVGEFLGFVGSSGWSWEPHLHFELSTKKTQSGSYMIDPNIGTENQFPQITWAPGIQRPYYDSAINKIMTHSSPPNFNVPCPTPAIINEKNEFNGGDSLYVASYYRDQLTGQSAQYTIYRSDDSIFETWTHNIPQDFPHPSVLEPDWANQSHFCWGYKIPIGSLAGNWRVEAEYEGTTYEHHFMVLADDPLPVFLSSFQLEQQDNSVLLTWSTESEVNNQGFIVKRKTKEEPQYTEIANCSHNPELIGRGTYSGSSVYSYKDSNVLPGQFYQYQVLSVTYLGSEEVITSGEILINNTFASILPRDIQLYQNYPNPFNGFTVIPYFLPEVMSVDISIYDLLGQKILTLVNAEKNDGNHKVVWNTNDTNLNSGVYFVVLKTSRTSLSNKCLIIN